MEFKRLQEKLGKTIVFVTHDVGEALLLGSRIALMESGKLHGVYRPEEFLSSEDRSVKAYVDIFRASQQMFR
jgi:osmoprotectant transport system ATP-binding protein